MLDIFQTFEKKFSYILPLPFTVSIPQQEISIKKLTRFQSTKSLLFYLAFNFHLLLCIFGFLHTILTRKIDKNDVRDLLQTFFICYDIFVGSPMIGMSYVLSFMAENVVHTMNVVCHMRGNNADGKLH